MTPGARIPLTEQDIAYLTSFLSKDIEEALAWHLQREDRLSKWDELYRAESKPAKKSFPWEGAANIVIPLIATTVDSILARIVNTVFSIDPFWTVKPLHKDFSQVAKPTEQFMEWSRNVEFNLYRPVKTWTNEVIKYGWSWMKPIWQVETKPYYLPTRDGLAREDIILRRPAVHHVMVQDVINQPGIEDETQAEWIAHRIRLTDGYLRWRAKEKVYENVEEIIKRKGDATIVHQSLSGGSDRGMQAEEKLNTLYEIQCDLPLPSHRDQPTVSMVLTWHQESKQIARAIYQPNYYGQRSLLKGSFVEYEGRQEAFGICRMLADLQEELTTIHRQQIDNATIANTRFFLGRRGAIKPGTKIWPGRFLTVSDPDKDLKAFQLGDIYQSMRQLEVSALAFAERRSGVTDYQLGRESNVLGSRATATGTLAIIQEGNRRFDLNVRDMRDTLSELGKRILQLNQQFRPKGLAYFVQGTQGMLTEATLDLPQQYIEQRLGVELTASTAVINREVEKQGLIALLGLLTQNLQMGQQAAMVVANPMMPGEVRDYTARAFAGLSEVMARVVERFEVKDVDAVVPTLFAQENPYGVGTVGSQQPGGAGANGAPPLPGGNPGMADVLRVAQGGPAGGAGGPSQLQ